MSPSFAERIVAIIKKCQHLEQLSVLDAIETGDQHILTMDKDNRCLHISSVSEALIVILKGLVSHKMEVRYLKQLPKK